MTLPDYQTLMLPLLEFVADKQEHSVKEAISNLANRFNLTKEDREELIPSGKSYKFNGRVSWASTYLKKAQLLSSTRRGYFQITSRGIEVLTKKPDLINVKFLEQYDEFITFHQPDKKNKKKNELSQEDLKHNTPEEALENAHQQ